jgi:Flp pilus assembly protein TadG
MRGVKRILGRSLWRDRKGNALVILTASLPLLIGAAGLAVDTAKWTYWKRQLQREADSAALAGAFARAQSKDAIAAATTDLARTNVITLSTPASITNAPTTGAFAGNADAVRVILSTAQRLPFSGSFMSAAPTITASATAMVVTTTPYCGLALSGGTATGITMTGNATLNLGCGIASNSTSKTAAVIAGGSSSISASPVAAVGALPTSGNYASGTQLLAYSLPQPDPFASLPTPAPSGCQGQVKVKSTDNTTLPAGCYKGMDIKGTLSLEAGIYYIDGDSFSVGSTATVTGTGVTIILTSSNAATQPQSIATLDVNGGATIQLSAPTSGTYHGVLFYQDRRALDTSVNKLNGNATSTLQGAIYFPSQELDFSGTTGMTTTCIQLVALRLTFIGNTTVSNSCPAGSGASAFNGIQVRLVE